MKRITKWRQSNIQIPDDGTWEEWKFFCKYMYLPYHTPGKQAGVMLIEVLRERMKSSREWKKIKEEKLNGR